MLPLRRLRGPDLASALLQEPPAQCRQRFGVPSHHPAQCHQRFGVPSHQFPELRIGVPDVVLEAVVEGLALEVRNTQNRHVWLVVRWYVCDIAACLACFASGTWIRSFGLPPTFVPHIGKIKCLKLSLSQEGVNGFKTTWCSDEAYIRAVYCLEPRRSELVDKRQRLFQWKVDTRATHCGVSTTTT